MSYTEIFDFKVIHVDGYSPVTPMLIIMDDGRYALASKFKLGENQINTLDRILETEDLHTAFDQFDKWSASFAGPSYVGLPES